MLLGRDHPVDLLARDWPGKEIPLELMAAERLQEPVLLLRFHAFGRDHEPERAPGSSADSRLAVRSR